MSQKNCCGWISGAHRSADRQLEDYRKQRDRSRSSETQDEGGTTHAAHYEKETTA